MGLRGGVTRLAVGRLLAGDGIRIPRRRASVLGGQGPLGARGVRSAHIRRHPVHSRHLDPGRRLLQREIDPERGGAARVQDDLGKGRRRLEEWGVPSLQGLDRQLHGPHLPLPAVPHGAIQPHDLWARPTAGPEQLNFRRSCPVGEAGRRWDGTRAERDVMVRSACCQGDTEGRQQAARNAGHSGHRENPPFRFLGAAQMALW